MTFSPLLRRNFSGHARRRVWYDWWAVPDPECELDLPQSVPSDVDVFAVSTYFTVSFSFGIWG